ncbi:UMP-CMP kinase [Scleroderma citrinum]
MSTKADESQHPKFNSRKVTVVYVLGGPGAGKGTQCTKIAKEFDFCHLSAGDLLRAEQNREGSQYGDLIRTCIREGTIVPMEVTIKLLEIAMSKEIESRTSGNWSNGKGRFLIDGFPRKMDQAVAFDETVCSASLVIHFTTTEDVMLQRLKERGKTSGREDDNDESIKKRFRTHIEQCMPVIQHYSKLGKLLEIDCSGSIDDVYELTSEAIGRLLS